jgi:hypothetical protein
MGYEIKLQADILRLLSIFRDHVLDKETHAWVTELVADEKRWPQAHDMFSTIRRRLLGITERDGRQLPPEKSDQRRASQYAFEELCLKTVFNETGSKAPFDSCSPFWVASCAINLARVLDIPLEAAIAAIAPEK